MTTAASVILDLACTTLLNPAPYRAWPRAELLSYLNLVQSAIVQVKADAFTKITDHTLAAGVDQTLPADGLSVVNIYRNVASKRACKQVGLDMLNSSNPTWAAETQNVNVREWVADQRTPTRFMVSPPNTGLGAVVLVYGAVPADLTAEADLISVADSYKMALWAGVVSLAYAKSSTTQDLQRSTAYLQMMNALITGKTATIKLNAPDLKQIEQAQS